MPNVSEVKSKTIGAAVLKLIGGESITIFQPNKELKLVDFMAPPAMGDDLPGWGSAIMRVNVDDFPSSVYVELVDARCRELFGFGLKRTGNSVALTKPVKPRGYHDGYSYTTDKDGRMMLIGDYAHELNVVYMKLLDEPMELRHRDDYQCVQNRSAIIYVNDLRKIAEWCGDTVSIHQGMVHITPAYTGEGRSE